MKDCARTGSMAKGRKRLNIKQKAKAIVGNDYVFTILTKIFALLIGFVASAFAKRYLGTQLQGQLSQIDAVLTIVAITANFGLYQPYPYYKRKGEAQVFDKFLRIFILQFLLYTVIGVVGARLFDSFLITAVCLIAPIQVLANQLSFMLMVEDVKFKNVVFFTARIVNTAITILAFFTMRPSLVVALALVVIGDVITVVMALVRFRRIPNPLRADLGFVKKIVPFGIVSMITTLMLQLNYKVDVLMMPFLGVSDAEIGLYSVGTTLSSYGWMIPDAFREVLFSRTAKSDAVEDLKKSLKYNLYITLVLIAGIVLLGRPAIELVYGAQWVSAYTVTVILMVGVLSMSYFKLISTLLLAQGKKGVYLAMLTGSVVINIVCNLLTIPLWGKEGAALASVISYTVAGALFLGYFMRTYGVRFSEIFVLRRADLREVIRRIKR